MKPDARSGWNEGADAWREFVHSGADYYRLEVHGPALLHACGAVHGLAALDLGCGEGYFSRQLARAGARVTALDLSERQLLHAREIEARETLGIAYVHLDARDVAARWPAHAFDLVTACMSLQDMDAADEVLRACAGVLPAAGRMVFSVPHPCGDMPVREWERTPAGEKVVLKVDQYFRTGPAVMHWNMPRLAYHWKTPYWRRTLEEWTTLTHAAGFLIRRVLEPRPTEAQLRALPALEDCARIPYFLIFDTQRQPDHD